MPQADRADAGDGRRRDNFVLLTYDSCRYDVLTEAQTPVLDSFAQVLRAQSPANFTYAAHHAFFAGILPHVIDVVEAR